METLFLKVARGFEVLNRRSRTSAGSWSLLSKVFRCVLLPGSFQGIDGIFNVIILLPFRPLQPVTWRGRSRLLVARARIMTASLGAISGNRRTCAYNIGEYARAQTNLNWLACIKEPQPLFHPFSGTLWARLDTQKPPKGSPVTEQLAYGGVEFTTQ